MSGFYPAIAGKACLDPAALYPQAVEQGLPLDFWHRANSYRCPLGEQPGEAWFLLLRDDVEDIDENAFQEAIFRADYHSTTTNDRNVAKDITIKKLLLTKALCMTPGATAQDPGAAYLVRFVDKRHILGMAVIGSGTAGEGQYNVRLQAVTGAATTSLYYSESLNSGSLWTWQTILDNLWGKLPSSAVPGSSPTLPYTPDVGPNNFRFIGVSAWRAYHAVLRKISCTTAYDPTEDTFSIVQLGEAQDGNTAKFRDINDRLLYDCYPIEGNAARVAEKIRVLFHRYDESIGVTNDTPRTGNFSMDSIYSVDHTTGTDGAMSGTVTPLWDDLPAIYDTAGSLTNSSALATRAAEVGANYVNMLTISNARMKRIYTGLVDTILPGSEVKEVIWRDYGDGVKTEIWCAPTLQEPTRGQCQDWIGEPGLAEWLMPPDLGRATEVAHPRILLGKLYEDLTEGGSAIVNIWRHDGSAWVDTGVTVTAYDWFMASGASTISAGKKVGIAWHGECGTATGSLSGRWIVWQAEC